MFVNNRTGCSNKIPTAFDSKYLYHFIMTHVISIIVDSTSQGEPSQGVTKRGTTLVFVHKIDKNVLLIE